MINHVDVAHKRKCALGLVNVIVRCSPETLKRLWKAMTVVCSTCIYWSRIFHVFLKFKRSMLAAGSMTMPLRVHMLRIYSVEILTINSLKMKPMVDFFV